MAGGIGFSLVDGGPLCALLRRLGWTLPDGRIDYLRACMVLVALAWGPLLVATLSARLMTGHAIAIDWGVHTRLLVAIPLLLRADVALHARTRLVIDRFVGRPLGRGADAIGSRTSSRAPRSCGTRPFPRRCCSASRWSRARSWSGTSAACSSWRTA